MPSSRGSSQPRDQTQISALQVDFLLSEPHAKLYIYIYIYICIYKLFMFFSIIVYYRTLNKVPCAINKTLLFIHCIYDSLRLLFQTLKDGKV